MMLHDLLTYFPDAKETDGQWMACCPAHDDKSPSLSIREAGDGKILLKCFANCSARDIVDAKGLKESDLFPEKNRAPKLKLSHPEAEPKSAFPPFIEVENLWAKATSIADDSQSRAWARDGRCLDPAKIAEHDLARVRATKVRATNGQYKWASAFGDWPYRVVLPNYEPSGKMVTLRARSINPTEKGGKKELASKGRAKGSFFANRPALAMLQGGEAAEFWLVEGGTDYLTAATTQPEMPIIGIHSGSASPELFSVLRQRVKKVVLAVDLDDAGDKYARQYAAGLLGVAVHRWVGVAGGTAKDLNDALRESGPGALLTSLQSAALFEVKPLPTTSSEPLPKITVSDKISANIDAAELALTNDPDVFQQDGRLVIVTTGEEPTIYLMTKPMVRERLTRLADWFKIDRRSDRPVRATPPDNVVDGLLDRRQWPNIRVLEEIYSHPYIKPNGELVTRRGYDEETKTLLTKDTDIQIVSCPTREDAIRATQELLDVVRDFPFASLSAQSAWLALLVTLTARLAIEGQTPLFAIDASTRGSGKSLLAELAGLLVLGRRPHSVTLSDDPAEQKKLIATLALENEKLALFDNIKEGSELGGAALESAITSGLVKDRLLGKNESLKRRLRAVFVATGNNVAFSSDMARRVLSIRLEPSEENPEDRQDFAHPNIRRWVSEERPRLLSALFTLIQGWFVAGKPGATSSWGSFESWSATVPAILRWVGLADPTETHRALVAEDVNKAALGELLVALRKTFGSTPTTAREIITAASKQTPSGAYDWTYANPELHDALESIAPRAGKPHTPKGLGRLLRSYKGRVVDGFCLACDLDPHTKAFVWCAKSATPKTTVAGFAGFAGFDSKPQGEIQKITVSIIRQDDVCPREGREEDPQTPQTPQELPRQEQPPETYLNARALAEERAQELAVEFRPKIEKAQPWEIEQLTNIVAGKIEQGISPEFAWAQVLRSHYIAVESEAPL